jgi:polyhydroxyalkanoate synthesis repressor PhaR
MAELIRVIKKYQNRKLYDTQDSCYVTLDGIAKMIRDNEDILVIDNNTKADVTALILTQVLYEQEKTNQSVLPVSILKNIVKSGSNNLFEFIQKYILGAIEAQLKTQEDIKGYLDRMVQKGDLTKAEADTLLLQLKTASDNARSTLDQRIEDRLERILGKRATTTHDFNSEYSTTANRTPMLDTR